MDQGMVEVELPVLRDFETIEQAFDTLRENRKGGFVVSGRGAVMVTARNLSQALALLRKNSRPLSEVVEQFDGPRPPTVGKGSSILGLLTREKPAPPTEDKARVLRLEGRSALVLVSERQAKALASPATFYICTADPSHVWLAEDLVRPGICNLDGEPVQLKI